MTTVGEIAEFLESIAPASLAEEWDNVGLLWGDREACVQRVLFCLTATHAVINEAEASGARLVVSHHPLPFRPIKRVIAGDLQTGGLWKLARAGISLVSLHTAFDNAKDGINALLAQRLGLIDLEPIRPIASSTKQGRPTKTYKVVAFVPREDHDLVLSAAFAAGAGVIGAYRECSYSSSGVGTFFGTDDANPTVGMAGRRENVRERRVELVCPAGRVIEVLEAVRNAHSYEEPAIDVYPLDSTVGADLRIGAGRVGRLLNSTTLAGFCRLVSELLDRAPYSVRRGSGEAHLTCGHSLRGRRRLSARRRRERCRRNADRRGSVSSRRSIAQSLGVGLVLAGHFATERPGVELLAELTAKRFPELECKPSSADIDPLTYL